MPTLPNMGLITPTLGGDSGTWDDKINAAFALVDAHDHTAGKGVPITVAALDIDDDLPMGGFAVTSLGKVSFSTIAAPTTGSKNLFVSTADNELYWRTNAGVNVKLTSGASINTTLVGGIVGDYATVGAVVAYDDANKRYTLKTQTNTWARLATGPVRVYEYNTNETVYVELAAPAALAASYTVTLPLAPPASTLAVQMSAAGVLSTSNTFSDYGNSTERYLYVSAGSAQTTATGPTFAANGNGWSLLTSTGRLIYPVDLHYGDTIQSFQVGVVKTSVVGTITVQLYKYNFATLTETPIGVGVTQSIATPAILLQESGLATTLASSSEFYYIVLTGGGTTGDAAYHALISYTRAV
jgi:hypothetical protein